MISLLRDVAQIYQQRAIESLSDEDMAHAKRYRLAADEISKITQQRDDLQLEAEELRRDLDNAHGTSELRRMRGDELENQCAALLTAVDIIETNADECLDFDEFTAMLVPIDDFHRLIEARDDAKGGAA